MTIGKIKKIMTNKGYGFIETDYQEGDLFFHKSNLDNLDFNDLAEGTSVEFDIADGRRGAEAVAIKLAGEAEEEPAAEEPEVEETVAEETEAEEEPAEEETEEEED